MHVREMELGMRMECPYFSLGGRCRTLTGIIVHNDIVVLKCHVKLPGLMSPQSYVLYLGLFSVLEI
jgi:hypothetical protein